MKKEVHRIFELRKQIVKIPLCLNLDQNATIGIQGNVPQETVIVRKPFRELHVKCSLQTEKTCISTRKESYGRENLD